MMDAEGLPLVCQSLLNRCGRVVQRPPYFTNVYLIKKEALRGIEWVKLVFPDVNMLVHVKVNVPEKE
jgi:hypothetical protein